MFACLNQIGMPPTSNTITFHVQRLQAQNQNKYSKGNDYDQNCGNK